MEYLNNKNKINFFRNHYKLYDYDNNYIEDLYLLKINLKLNKIKIPLIMFLQLKS